MGSTAHENSNRSLRSLADRNHNLFTKNSMYLEREIKQDLLNIRNGALITPILKKIMKLLVCENCLGKGYGTKTEYAVSRRSHVKLPSIVFCSCPRGKQLSEIFGKMI